MDKLPDNLTKETKKIIDDHLSLLMRKADVLVEEKTYRIPKAIKKNIKKSDFSNESMQKLADDICDFLGIYNPIKVYMLSKMTDHIGIAGSIGTYNARRVGKSEVNICKEHFLRFEHYVAIIVHEIIHHYLNERSIFFQDEYENEVLTDIAAIFMGFGHFFAKAYDTIHWTEDIDDPFNSFRICTVKIGYLHLPQVQYALYKTARLREIERYIFSVPVLYQLKLGFFFLILYMARRQENNRRRKKQKEHNMINQVLSDIEKQYTLLEEAYNLIMSAPPAKASGPEANEVVDIVNRMSTGQVKQEVESCSADSDLNRLQSLVEKITRWNRILAKINTAC